MTANIAMGGAPDGGDVPAEMLEVVNNFESALRIFMIRFDELEGVCSRLIVDADENRGAWSCDSEDRDDGFLYHVEFGIVHFSLIAERVASVLQQVELLVSAVVNSPSTADSAIFQFGAVGVYDDGMDGECTQPFFVMLLWPRRLVWTWRCGLRYSWHC
jgi:hypothetical protein